MASTDAKPVPQKNVAYRITFPIYDADGDLVTGATGLDSEVSKDGGAFADCTNEATEIGSSGIYTLDLTSTEMNADTVAIIVKTTSSGAKTSVVVMYPEEAGDIRVNVTVFGGTAGTFSGGRPEVNTSHAAGTAWNSGAIGANTLAADAITAAKVAADVSAEIADAVWDEDATGHQTGGTFGQAIGDPGADTNTIFKAVVTDATGATVGVDVAAVLADTGTDGVVVASINANAITASAIAADAITDAKVASDVTIASVTGAVGSVTGNVGGNVTGSVGSLAAQAKADVNAEVLDVLNTDTFAEPGQEAPGATVSLVKKIGFLYKAWRNKSDQTATLYQLYADDASTVDQKATVSDDATTFTSGEKASGP